uniref:Uncharacterized protein n=1 Tax=Syphacia muris TaxID=451379 RepID=A0A0N5A9Q2_9BILA
MPRIRSGTKEGMRWRKQKRIGLSRLSEACKRKEEGMRPANEFGLVGGARCAYRRHSVGSAAVRGAVVKRLTASALWNKILITDQSIHCFARILLASAFLFLRNYSPFHSRQVFI